MKNVVIFLPAYNAEKTLQEVWKKIPQKYHKNTFLIDDNSGDNTFTLSKKIGIESYKNTTNLGYGGNVKMCLKKAMEKGADIIIEMHPDNEYDAAIIEPALLKITKHTGMVLGNRFTKKTEAIKNGMYLWKYLPSRFLSWIDNKILGTAIADLHQGFRIYTRQLLEKGAFQNNTDSYLFSFEIIAQTIYYGYSIEEIPVFTHYTGKKRGASFINSLLYFLETFSVLLQFLFAKWGFYNSRFPKIHNKN